MIVVATVCVSGAAHAGLTPRRVGSVFQDTNGRWLEVWLCLTLLIVGVTQWLLRGCGHVCDRDQCHDVGVLREKAYVQSMLTLASGAE